MPQILRRKIFTVFAVLLFFGGSAFAQLSNFTLTVTPTNESRTANGALNFSVSGTTAGATIVYRIFRLPHTATPIAATSANSFTGLAAGNYRVVATQSSGNENNQQQQDAAILNMIVPFSYALAGQKAVCGNDGEITVNAMWRRFGDHAHDYQWHGQDFNGNESPDATYYNYFRLDSGIEETGWVYVNR